VGGFVFGSLLGIVQDCTYEHAQKLHVVTPKAGCGL
jgi:hypothetical protein